MNEPLRKIVNLFLRGLTLACKFTLIFVLAKYLDPADVGIYGLLAATIGYCIYILGLDFYTFSNREMISSKKETWGQIIKNQGMVAILAYIIITPMLVMLFESGTLPKQYIAWFFLILILEHISQEAHRILIATSQPLMASTVLFIRSGLWVIAIITLMFVDPRLRSTYYVFSAWAVGAFLAIMLTAVNLKGKKIGGWNKSIQWKWIIEGCKVAAPFLIATLAIRGIYTIDRFWIEKLTNVEILAAYVLFMGMSNALVSFADSGIFSFSYPKLILQWQNKTHEEYKSTLKNMLTNLGVLSCLFSITSILLINPILKWIDREIYTSQVEIYYWLLASSIVISISMIPHFALYAQGKDRPIIVGQTLGLVAFAVTAFTISKIDATNAIPISVFCSFSFILAWKTAAYYLLTPKEYLLFRR
ncbi:MAG: hypothetical protein COA41_12295 [Sphingopyxis sp.]|nr:MAG: hypothetical protein COA41_12295 [Sphingopyxis sp.]